MKRTLNITVTTFDDSVSDDDFLKGAVFVIKQTEVECFGGNCNQRLHFLEKPEIILKMAKNLG